MWADKGLVINCDTSTNVQCRSVVFFTSYHHQVKVLFLFVFRKREEEQRRREAVQQVMGSTTEKRKTSPVKTGDQEQLSLANMIENLSMKDSTVEKKKSSKSECVRSKEERQKGKTLTPSPDGFNEVSPLHLVPCTKSTTDFTLNDKHH